MGEAFNSRGNYPKAMEVKLTGLEKAEKLKDLYLIALCQNFLGALYIKTEDYQKALYYYNTAKANKVFLMKVKNTYLVLLRSVIFT
jgi:hypothetical protein